MNSHLKSQGLQEIGNRVFRSYGLNSSKPLITQSGSLVLLFVNCENLGCTEKRTAR